MTPRTTHPHRHLQQHAHAHTLPLLLGRAWQSPSLLGWTWPAPPHLMGRVRPYPSFILKSGLALSFPSRPGLAIPFLAFWLAPCPPPSPLSGWAWPSPLLSRGLANLDPKSQPRPERPTPNPKGRSRPRETRANAYPREGRSNPNPKGRLLDTQQRRTNHSRCRNIKSLKTLCNLELQRHTDQQGIVEKAQIEVEMNHPFLASILVPLQKESKPQQTHCLCRISSNHEGFLAAIDRTGDESKGSDTSLSLGPSCSRSLTASSRRS